MKKYSIYEEYHINLCECSLYGYCDITYSLLLFPNVSNTYCFDHLFSCLRI